jgi:uncharacterized membrane protein YeaQ/YmgE (transglycosylase-associated protein family)
MVLLGLVEWVVVGLVVGFVASKVVDLRGDDPRLGVFVAVGGAAVAAALYTIITGVGIGGWRPWALAWAAAGAAAGALVWHLVRSRYVSHERHVPRRSY